MYQEEERSKSKDRMNRSVDGKKLDNLYKQHKTKQYRMEELKKEIDRVIYHQFMHINHTFRKVELLLSLS
jgi:hypothetical protein